MKKTKFLVVFLILFSFVVLGLIFTLTTSAGETYPKRISVASDGTEGNHHSTFTSPLAISADGRYVGFSSHATNFISNDMNGTASDGFLYNRDSDSIELFLDIRSTGIAGSGNPNANYISPDGRYVVFFSSDPNIVPGDTNNVYDAFLYDRDTEIVERVSIASDGTQGDDRSTFASASSDGRYVVFESMSSNLVSGDTNGTKDIFVHDRAMGVTERVSVASDGSEGDRDSSRSSVSADGRYVVFESASSNLVLGDTNGTKDIFVHDRATGVTERVSVASDGSEGDRNSNRSSVSADGRYVVFESMSSNLVPGDTNGTKDIFVYDRATGVTERVSVASDGIEANGASGTPSTISVDGRYIVFESLATNLVSEDTNGVSDIFVHDRFMGLTERVSVASDGTEADGVSFRPGLSADGRYVVFDSHSSNLVADDTNGFRDVFLTQNPLFTDIQNLTLSSIGGKIVNEGELLKFSIFAIDPKNDNFTFSASNLPSGATFDTQTAIFSWTPNFVQAGNYTDVEFTVLDDGTPMELDFELITITVRDVNRPPVFDVLDTTQQVDEDILLTIKVSATDPDGNNITFSAANLPINAIFNVSIGVFEWTPDVTQEGVYVVTFSATDDGMPAESADIDVVISVNDVPTPAEQAEDLVDEVIFNDFDTNIENSYLANLKKVEKFIGQSRIQAATNQLEVFIIKAEQDLANGSIDQATAFIDQVTADKLIQLAENLINDLQEVLSV